MITQRRFAPLGRLDRYVTSIFISSYATSLLVVLGLFFVMDMASNLDRYLQPWPDGTKVATSTILRFYALNVPFLFLQSAPFVTLTAGMFTVVRLMKTNEIEACLAAGISARRALLPVFLGGLVVACFVFGLREWMAVSLVPKRDAIRYTLTQKSYERVYEKLWLRDLNGSVVRLGEYRPAAGDPPVSEIRDLRAVLRDDRGTISIEADRAVWTQRADGPAWRLENGVQKIVGQESRTRESIEWLDGFEFTPEMALTFQRNLENPLELSFAEALSLAHRDPDSVVYQTLLQYHLTFPLANLVLLLIGVPLLLRHDRGSGAEGLAKGLLLCVFFFGFDFVFRNLGIQGDLDPLVASWAPVILFGSVGVVLYDSIAT
ncbi:MAG: LptF/LptG family permease [Planctomycetes bacterium]|nr:LptF/LptG family permease [Planctomycetota bacterium]MCB9903412.1 LptF/LptG family permease [Planctomycetota bacterium]